MGGNGRPQRRGFMLDFTKVKTRVLNLKLTDGNVILVRMPTKHMFDVLIEMQNTLAELEIANAEQVEYVYQMAAELLSNNRQGKKIEKGYVEKLFDIEDIQILFEAYVNFVAGQTSDPNSNPLDPRRGRRKGQISVHNRWGD